MKAFFWSSLLLGLCFAVPAQAQYDNHRMGAGAGAMYFAARDKNAVWGFVPLAPEYSLYIENGFDVGLQVPLVILYDTENNNRQYFAMGLSANFRYLIMEETLRPYVGAQLGGIYIFGRAERSFFFDIGPMVGIDFFVSDAWSLGPRLFANLHWALNERLRYSIGMFFTFHTYF